MASSPASPVFSGIWACGSMAPGPDEEPRAGHSREPVRGPLSNPHRWPAGEQTYLESTNDQECVDAVGSHLSCDVLQVLPREGAGEVQGGDLRQDPLCAPPTEAKRHDTQGQGAPRATWLGDSMAGEPPTVGAARSQVSKRRSFQKKMGRNFAASSQLDLRNPHCLVRDMVNHGSYQTFTAVIVWMETSSFRVTYRVHTTHPE